MKKVKALFTIVLCLYLIPVQAADLPYRTTLVDTLCPSGWIKTTPATFAPTSDFTINFTAVLSSNTTNAIEAKATNSSCLGFSLKISATGIIVNNDTIDRSNYADGQKHEFRIALKANTQTLYIYRDEDMIINVTAQLYGSIIYPTIFETTDDSIARTGIYNASNMIKNPGFETPEITYDPIVTGSSDIMFWPADWNVYNADDKSVQWNLGVRCYKNKSIYAAGREGESELMFRQDGGGGFTTGSAIYQKLGTTLKPNHKYRVSFEVLSHSNSTGNTFAIGIGSAPGSWNCMYETWTSPSDIFTTRNYSFDFTAPSVVGDNSYLGFICTGTKGIVHIDRVTLVEATGNYNSCTLTPMNDIDDITIGTTTYSDMAFSSEAKITNELYSGGEYIIYNPIYNKVLGNSKDSSKPQISTWETNDSLSYVFTAIASSDIDSVYYLIQKSTGKYLTASTSNTYGMTFTSAAGSEKSSLWRITTGIAGTIQSVYGNGYLGCDSVKTDNYISVWYDKIAGDYSRWQIVEADFPLNNTRLKLYTASLEKIINEGENIYNNSAYGTANDKIELAEALYNARSADETASLDSLDVMETAREALEAAIKNTKENNYEIWLSGSSFNTSNAFTIAMKGTQLTTNSDASVQFVVRNSVKTGAVITIGNGYVKVGNIYISQSLDNKKGRHDYQFAFDGSTVTLYFDNEKIGSGVQYEVPTVTSCGTSAEWTVLGINALIDYDPELISTDDAVAPNENVKNIYGKVERTSLMMIGQSQTLDSAVDLHILAGSNAMTNSSLNITTEDAWLIFDNIRPSEVINTYLKEITINGETAVNGINCRVAIYLQGAAVIPHQPTYISFIGYSGQMYTGENYSFSIEKATVGKAANKIQSFILKRGYMACLAINPDGSGYSRIYVADHEDKKIDVLPDLLNQRISYIYVRKWNYVSKKGWSSTEGTSAISAEGTKVGATWFYTWGADRTTQTDMEYVPQKSKLYWPSWDIISQDNSTCALGYNEPDHSEQHEGSTISSWTACTNTPNFFASGLRIGSPAPTDAGWLTEYIEHCNDMGYRCDFVAYHAYWGTNEAANAASWKSQLQTIYNKTKRPIWLTEWNNGASWTTETWPSSYSSKLAKQKTAIKNILAVLDDCDFIERYAIYNWDSYYRAVMSWDSNNNSWWVTPAGEIYRDDHPTFAYNESVQFVPIGWFPSFKTTFTLNAEITTDHLLNISITNPNGDFTGSQILEIKKADSTYSTFYEEKDRSVFDKTSSYILSFKIDTLDNLKLFTSDSLTIRMKETSLDGTKEAYTSDIRILIPESVRTYFNNCLGIECNTSEGLSVVGGIGKIIITNDTPRNIIVYDISGKIFEKRNIKAGTTEICLSKGIYLINREKVMVK